MSGGDPKFSNLLLMFKLPGLKGLEFSYLMFVMQVLPPEGKGITLLYALGMS